MKRKIISVILVAFLMQGCGTIIYGTKQDLAIDTIPPGVSAKIGEQQCTTPCRLADVPRTEKRIYFEKDSQKKEFRLTRDLNFFATIVGNILWLLPGVVVDVAFGGAFDIKPVNVELDKLEDAQEL